MEELEAAHRRELAFIASCSDVPRLLGRMAAYKADLELARENEWKANAIYAEHLLDVAAKRFTALNDAAHARDREAERSRAAAMAAPRPLPPPARATPPMAYPSPRPPPATPPSWSRSSSSPRWTPPPRLPEPPPRYLRLLPRTAPVHTDDEDVYFEEPPRPPPPPRASPSPRRPTPPPPVVVPPLAIATSSAPTVAPVPPAAPTVAAGRLLTGRDLADFCARRGLTLRAAAVLLGSLSGTLSKAISAGDRPLPEKLQIALRAALNG